MQTYSIHPSIRVILKEHARLRSIVNAMTDIAQMIEKTGKTPDLKVFRAMLLYIRDYPEKIHHPKEDEFLFSALKQRTAEVNDTIAELEMQHSLGDQLVLQLEHALNRFELEGGAAFGPFKKLAQDYARFYASHMRMEEEIILPAAERALTEADWAKLDAAFGDEAGRTEEDARLGKIFTTIANIAPAPVGLGPEL